MKWMLATVLLCSSAFAEEALPDPILLGPRTGPEREAANRKYGGTEKTTAAIASGLDWLARHVGEDGLWDADLYPERCAKDGKKCEGIGKGQHGEDMPCPFDGAISALAVLAFLGDGHAPDPEGDTYAKLVDKALGKLERAGDGWTLAIATEALAEAEAMERKGRWTAAVKRNVEQLLSMKNEDGAWSYVNFRAGSDTPFSALVIQALVAAQDVGCALPQGLADGVDRWLNSLEEHKGRLAYLKEGRKYGYTPTRTNGNIAAALRELLQVGLKGQRHGLHMGCVINDKPLWKIAYKEIDVPGRGKMMVQEGNLSGYQWYYGTIACFHYGGSTWSGWFSAAKSAYLPNQRKDGCAKGSWDPIGTYEEQTGGRVFGTALGVLILEQPFRQKKLGK